MRPLLCLLALIALGSCATMPRSDDWPSLAGCWIDGSDVLPHPSMAWSADPDHLGAYVGAWRIDAAGDIDAVDFTLAPLPDQRMRFCTSSNGGTPFCGVARLNHARPHPGDTAVFYITVTELEFGSLTGTAPFFWGTRGACA